jgi:hypothetical protein
MMGSPADEDEVETIGELMRQHADERCRHGAAWDRSPKARSLTTRIAEMKDRARTRFADARGWKRTRREFHVFGLIRGLRHSPIYTSLSMRRELSDISRELGYPWFDHAEYFKTPGRGGICAGIVSHAYLGRKNDNEGPEEAMRYAEGVGLACEVLPSSSSWYYPGATTLLVFTRRPA